ncbi:MAG: FkbM family methyltransferase [Mycolicibacterium sp.]|nr:FkbM family methyltransferase [Mycolicibacterium sp.]
MHILLVRGWRQALFGQRVAAATEHVRVLRSIPELSTIVDVGANRGQFGLAARHCFPESRIIAFEPLARPAEIWRSVFASDTRTLLFEAALGPRAGEMTINVAGQDDSSSLLPITAAQSKLFPGTGRVGTETVKMTRLVEQLPVTQIEAPALLKIDVQGFELQALIGCEDLLDRFAWVYVECSFVELYEGQALADEIIDWLRQRGFSLVGVHHVAYSAGASVQGDFLFARNNRNPPH